MSSGSYPLDYFLSQFFSAWLNLIYSVLCSLKHLAELIVLDKESFVI